MKRILSLTLSSIFMLLTVPCSFADQAALVEETVLVALVSDKNNLPTRATYKSSGNWAITSPTYMDATIAVFNFGGATSVSQATLKLPLEAFYTQGGAAHLKIFAYAADGPVSLDDFSSGSRIPVAELDAVIASGNNSTDILSINVTGVTNAILSSSRLVAYRIVSALAPADVITPVFPAFRGVKFTSGIKLEFSPGSPSSAIVDRTSFDGYLLSLPGLSAPGIGAFDVTLRVVDHDSLTFALHSAVDVGTPGLIDGSALSGAQLLNCSAFSKPPGTEALMPGAPIYSAQTGRLDIPRLRHDGKDYQVQMQLVSAGEPMLFRLNSVEPVQPDTNSNGLLSIAEIGGNLSIQPSQDFIPLCHGWILIGDTSRNALVERNVITGATGHVYPFNTTPDKLVLDAANQIVYLTTKPATERLYRLNLVSKQITYRRLREGNRHLIPISLAPAENGNIFAILFDPDYLEEEPKGPANKGLWMGLINPNGMFVRPNVPMEEPKRIEYDPVRKHVLVATESNLVTFVFDPVTLTLDFVPNTDVTVGSGCTDFSISPDGYRLAYSCPQGNATVPRNSIIDMNPLDYYDADGEWNLNGSPISASFTADGETLIATDGARLYFFNVFNHLLRGSFNLDLAQGESVRKVRVSRDGQLVMVFMNATLDDATGRVYWLSMPVF